MYLKCDIRKKHIVKTTWFYFRVSMAVHIHSLISSLDTLNVGYTFRMGSAHSKGMLPKELQSGLGLEIWEGVNKSFLYWNQLFIWSWAPRTDWTKNKYSTLKLPFFLSKSLHTLERQNDTARAQALELDCLTLNPSYMACVPQFPLVYIEIISIPNSKDCWED